MTQQFLNGSDVVVVLEEVRSTGMPQRVGAGPLGDAGLRHRPLDLALEYRLVKVVSAPLPAGLAHPRRGFGTVASRTKNAGAFRPQVAYNFDRVERTGAIATRSFGEMSTDYRYHQRRRQGTAGLSPPRLCLDSCRRDLRQRERPTSPVPRPDAADEGHEPDRSGGSRSADRLIRP